jgi:hypothetical protein
VFPLFSTGVGDTGGKFATGINDTSGIGGKFAVGDPNAIIRDLGKMVHEKNQKKKIS